MAKDYIDTRFLLKHYAGDVIYNVTEFLSKNMDTLYADHIYALQTSGLHVVSTMFPDTEDPINNKKRPVTAAVQFKVCRCFGAFS